MGIRDRFNNLIRRRTPTPAHKEVYNLGIQEMKHPQHVLGPVLYNVADQSVVVRTCITQLKTEIFRRGYMWEKAFVKKCVSCGEEFQSSDVEECPSCGGTEFVTPDPMQKKYAEKMVEGYVNKSDQLFIDILKEIETDLNIADDAYLIFVKEYYLDELGNIKLHKVKELYRGDPLTMFIDVDEDGDRGTSHYTCVTHRDVYTDDPHEHCPECGAALHPVVYVNRVHGKEQYFIEGEVVHISKFSPSRLYGKPPILTLWTHVTTLIAMENYINTSYSKARTPKGILAVQTNNMDSLVRYWRGVKEKLEKDPHYIPIMGIETEAGGRGGVNWVPFMQSLKEMDYSAVKDDLRLRIGAFYGVSPIFQADNTTGGGLNNEGLQVTVTNRTVELAQSVYNKYLFPFMEKQFGITDWKIRLLRSEEEDDTHALRRREVEVNLAGQMKNLGFDVDMDEDGNFIYKKIVEVDKQIQQAKQSDGFQVDPFAGTDVDAAYLGQMQAQSLQQANQPVQTQGRGNQSSSALQLANRTTGSPAGTANENVDRRTETR